MAVELAGMLAIFVGLILILLGLARLGFVANLLSTEVQVGYLNGLAVTIIVGQLPKLFGFSTDADGFVDEVRAFVRGHRRPERHRPGRRRRHPAWCSWACRGSPAPSRRCSSPSSVPRS